MNTEKNWMQERSGVERPLTDLDTRFMELFHQLSDQQKRVIALSAILSAAVSSCQQLPTVETRCRHE